MIYHTFAPAKGVAYAVLALAWAGSCSFARAAQENSDESAAVEDTVLAPVTVSAHGGLAVPYDTTGVSVTVLDAAEMRSKGITNLSDALTTVPGVAALPGGGANQRGNVSNISVRGMSKDSAVMPMIDGMRVGSVGSSSLVSANTFARTNLFDLETVEVLRGAQGATYGCGSMGGVVYMETPEGAGVCTQRLFNEGGSHDSYTGNLMVQGAMDKLSYFLSSTYEHTNNDLRFADGSRPDVKHAGRYTNYAQAVRLDYRLNEATKATMTYRREDAEFGYAGRYMGWLSAYPYSFRTNLATAKIQTTVDRRWTTNFMTGYSGTDNMLGHGYNENTRNVQTEWRHAYKWNERHTTTAGLAWNRRQYTVDSGEGKRNTNRNLENVYGFFGEHSYSPSAQTTHSLALRWDESNLFDHLLTARLSTSRKFNRDRTRVFGSVGQGYNAPSAFQRMNGTATVWGTPYTGNPDLDCETTRSMDVGAEQEWLTGHFASATYFLQRTEDAITSVWNGSGVTWINNPSHTTSQGVELSLHGTWESAWNTGYTLSYTYTQPKDSNDRQPGSTMRQVWSADVHTSPTEHLTAGVGLSAASGRRDFDSYDRRPLDSYYTLRCYASYEVNEHLRLHVRVENLTDQKFVTEGSAWVQDSILCAGASVHGGCTLSF